MKTGQIHHSLVEEEARAGIDFVSTVERIGESFLSPNTLPTIQGGIAAREALISLHLGEAVSYVWALTNDRLEMHPIAAGPKLGCPFGSRRGNFQ